MSHASIIVLGHDFHFGASGAIASQPQQEFTVICPEGDGLTAIDSTQAYKLRRGGLKLLRRKSKPMRTKELYRTSPAAVMPPAKSRLPGEPAGLAQAEADSNSITRSGNERQVKSYCRLVTV